MAIKTTEPIGATAVRLGYSSTSDLLRALEEQARRQRDGAERIALGELMVELGILDPRQLQRVLGKNATSLIPITDDAIRLAARLDAALQPSERILLVTSVTRGEGASEISVQLALAFAFMDKGPILLVNAHLRADGGTHPQPLYSQFAVPSSPGLSDLIEGRTGLDATTKRTKVPHLQILPAGTGVQDPLSLLLSDEFTRATRSLRERFALVVLDAPPMLDHPDTPVLAPRADAALLIIAAGVRRKDEVASAKRILDGLGVKILGAALSENAGRRR